MESEQVEIEIDEVFERIGIGLFHYRLLFICGLAFMADSLEVNLLSFLSTCVGAEWNLSNTEKATITSIVFLGIILGSLFWGYIADIYGRKTSFFLSSVLVSLGGFLSGIAPSFPVLIFFRFIVGIGIGGANIPFDLLAEFLPDKERGDFLLYIEYFWTFGSLFVTGIAWLTLENYGWRLLAVLTAIPVATTCIFSVFYLPESPRWLISKHRPNDASIVIQKVAKINGVELNDFRLKDYESETNSNINLLLEPSIRSYLLPLILIWGIFGFTYYGIILFVSRLYNNTDNDDDSTSSCSFDYSSIFINSLSEFAGVTLSVLLLNKIGRIKIQIIFYFLAGIFVFIMGLMSNKSWILLFFSMLGRMTIMVSSNSTWVITPEILSTETRTLGHAICVASSKIGAFVSPFIVISKLDPFLVGLFLGLFNILAAYLAIKLPETSGHHLGISRSISNLSDDKITSRLLSS